MEKLQDATSEELIEVTEDVGPKIAEGVHEFFAESANRKLIECICARAGVNMKEERAALKDTRFAGMTFVFTGTLTKRSRAKRPKRSSPRTAGKPARSV